MSAFQMARLYREDKGSLLQEDVVQLIHDKVLSLCQNKYQLVNSLEIDGLICISLLDSKEQQVVKIHKTLTSVSVGLQRNNEVLDKQKETRCIQEENRNFSVDIGNLDTLLKETTKTLSNSENSIPIRNKRKRKQPIKQALNGEQSFPQETEHKKRKTSESENNDYSAQSYPKINPFIHPPERAKSAEPVCQNFSTDTNKYTESKGIVVKEEPIDTGYEAMIGHNTATVDRDLPMFTNVSSYIGRLIDHDFRQENEKSSVESSSNKTKSNHLMSKEGSAEVLGIKVKSEQVDDIASVSEASGTGDELDCRSAPQLGDKELLSHLYGPSLLEPQVRNKRPRMKNQRNVDEQTWIELVKNNVSKYQAALQRSGKSNVNVNVDNLNLHEPSSSEQSDESSVMVTPHSTTLMNLLTSPFQNPRVKAIRELESGTLKYPSSHSKSENLLPQKSRSLSPTPVVKIERDDDSDQNVYIGHSSSNSREHSLDKQSGMLESKYPALVNQLMVSSSRSPSQSAYQLGEQSESLLNRLPFISFQEIFQTTSGPMNQINIDKQRPPSNQQETSIPQKPSLNVDKQFSPRFKPKSRWNWKKRLVGRNGGERKSPRRSSKNRSDSDSEWTPSAVNDDNEEAGASVARRPSNSRPTRGSKPKINFAELDVSDAEDSEPPIELVSAYCTKNCGQTFSNLKALEDHEKGCKGEFFLFHALTSKKDQVVIPFTNQDGQPSSSAKNFKCDLCGLDFNQEYRLHYHKVKVHGAPDQHSQLFR